MPNTDNTKQHYVIMHGFHRSNIGVKADKKFAYFAMSSNCSTLHTALLPIKPTGMITKLIDIVVN